MKKTYPLIFLVVLISLSPLAAYVGFSSTTASSVNSSVRVINIKAYQFGFEPNIIRVNVGERIILRVTSLDITHGIYIDGYSVSKVVLPGKVTEIGPLSFDKPGKLKIRCLVACGPLHPFMVADLVVEPNYPLPTFLISTIAVAGATVLYIRKKPLDEILGVTLGKSIDLLRVKAIGPILKRLVQWRGIHFFLIWPNLLVFMIVITTGLFGNPLGAKNFSIALVWILWFAAVEYMIFFGGRLWCTLCPLPAFGEWLVRRRVYGVHQLRNWLSFKRKFPRKGEKLDNMWGPALGFLGISLIVPWLVTRPVISGLLFLLLIIIAFIAHTIFTHRYFCRYICPAGGYIGYHANASIYAVRSRDRSICDGHIAKECIGGSPEGYGCPWKLYPGGNDRNLYCNQCYECLKSCPLDNMTIKLRMIGQDIANIAAKANDRFDEAWMGFIRFTLAIIYEMVFFGPYFWIKDWGNMGVVYGANLLTINLLTPTLEGLINWSKWAVIVGGVALAVYPAIFFGFSWLAKKAVSDMKYATKQIFLSFSYALSPFGLFLWMAFAIPLLAVNWSYPLTALSDPLGWGWNLFGTKTAWNPFHPDLVPYVQAPIMLTGLAIGINSTYNIAMKLFENHGKALRASAVMTILHTLAALLFIWFVFG